MRRLAPILLVIVGAALMIAQIRTDSEPGAIPLALVVLGLGAYVVVHVRRRSRALPPDERREQP